MSHIYHCSCSMSGIVFPGERIGLAGELGQSPPSIHVSKRLLFSIVHEKSGKVDPQHIT